MNYQRNATQILPHTNYDGYYLADWRMRKNKTSETSRDGEIFW